MLGHRLRRWPDIEPTSVARLVVAGEASITIGVSMFSIDKRRLWMVTNCPFALLSTEWLVVLFVLISSGIRCVLWVTMETGRNNVGPQLVRRQWATFTKWQIHPFISKGTIYCRLDYPSICHTGVNSPGETKFIK